MTIVAPHDFEIESGDRKYIIEKGDRIQIVENWAKIRLNQLMAFLDNKDNRPMSRMDLEFSFDAEPDKSLILAKSIPVSVIVGSSSIILKFSTRLFSQGITLTSDNVLDISENYIAARKSEFEVRVSGSPIAFPRAMATFTVSLY